MPLCLGGEELLCAYRSSKLSHPNVEERDVRMGHPSIRWLELDASVVARPFTKLREKTGIAIVQPAKGWASPKDHFTSTFTRIQGWMQH